jgi:hypothetical protein
VRLGVLAARILKTRAGANPMYDNELKRHDSLEHFENKKPLYPLQL